MKPDEFLKTIYFADCACKSIVLDGWKDEVKIQIDSLSRIRGETWNFYTAEDVEDGYLVFEGVDHVSFDPPGRIPNDEFGEIDFLGFDGERFTVAMEIGSGYQLGDYVKVKTTIRAKAIAIEKPGEETARIRD